MNISIRKMMAADLEKVVAIDQLSFSLPWPDSAFSTELNNPDARCWVVCEDETVVGFVVIWLVLDEAHVATIAIDEPYRGKGYSAALLKRALQSAYLEGSRIGYLEVRESNQVAISMYHSFGFEVAGLRKEYYKDNHENALLMTMTNFSRINE